MDNAQKHTVHKTQIRNKEPSNSLIPPAFDRRKIATYEGMYAYEVLARVIIHYRACVTVLPRFYDRMVIADAFSLSYDLLDKTTDLETGEWLFVSYKATKQRNVPVFLKTPNNEEILTSKLSGASTASQRGRVLTGDSYDPLRVV